MSPWADGLRACGIDAIQQGAHLVFDLVAPIGPLSGETLKFAIGPPADFQTAPHWLHTSSDLRRDDGRSRASELGSGWVKWSRPVPDKSWRGDLRSVRTYLAHVNNLLRGFRR